MAIVTLTIPLVVLATVGIGKVVRDFDRKMVAAGQRRKAESAARAAAAAVTGRAGKLAATRAADGTVQYAVQFDGEDTKHRLAFGTPESSGATVPFRMLPG